MNNQARQPRPKQSKHRQQVSAIRKSDLILPALATSLCLAITAFIVLALNILKETN
jgi:hypothetical protein